MFQVLLKPDRLFQFPKIPQFGSEYWWNIVRYMKWCLAQEDIMKGGEVTFYPHKLKYIIRKIFCQQNFFDMWLKLWIIQKFVL